VEWRAWAQPLEAPTFKRGSIHTEEELSNRGYEEYEMSGDVWTFYRPAEDRSHTAQDRIYQDSTFSAYYTIWHTPRQVLVIVPEIWSDEDTLAYEKLIHEIDTPWSIDMIIRGDVLITNPNIEIREMKDFIPLLKHHTAPCYVKRIEEFIKEHPLV